MSEERLRMRSALARFVIIAVAVVVNSLAASAAPLGHFPSQVQTPPIKMTGLGYVPAPTPSPHVMEGHFPAAVTTPRMLMTGLGYVPAPTPTPHVTEGHFPATVTTPALNMTGTGGS
jgi:hypothetical protein